MLAVREVPPGLLPRIELLRTDVRARVAGFVDAPGFLQEVGELLVAEEFFAKARELGGEVEKLRSRVYDVSGTLHNTVKECEGLIEETLLLAVLHNWAALFQTRDGIEFPQLLRRFRDEKRAPAYVKATLTDQKKILDGFIECCAAWYEISDGFMDDAVKRIAPLEPPASAGTGCAGLRMVVAELYRHLSRQGIGISDAGKVILDECAEKWLVWRPFSRDVKVKLRSEKALRAQWGDEVRRQIKWWRMGAIYDGLETWWRGAVYKFWDADKGILGEMVKLRLRDVQDRYAWLMPLTHTVLTGFCVEVEHVGYLVGAPQNQGHNLALSRWVEAYINHHVYGDAPADSMLSPPTLALFDGQGLRHVTDPRVAYIKESLARVISFVHHGDFSRIGTPTDYAAKASSFRGFLAITTATFDDLRRRNSKPQSPTSSTPAMPRIEPESRLVREYEGMLESGLIEDSAYNPERVERVFLRIAEDVEEGRSAVERFSSYPETARVKSIERSATYVALLCSTALQYVVKVCKGDLSWDRDNFRKKMIMTVLGAAGALNNGEELNPRGN